MISESNKFNHFVIKGLGITQEAAAKDFMNNFNKQFPKVKGLYDLMLRSPLTYDVDLDGNHQYYLRGSAALVVDMNLNSKE